jgi:hypothetical protein
MCIALPIACRRRPPSEWLIIRLPYGGINQKCIITFKMLTKRTSARIQADAFAVRFCFVFIFLLLLHWTPINLRHAALKNCQYVKSFSRYTAETPLDAVWIYSTFHFYVCYLTQMPSSRLSPDNPFVNNIEPRCCRCWYDLIRPSMLTSDR